VLAAAGATVAGGVLIGSLLAGGGASAQSPSPSPRPATGQQAGTPQAGVHNRGEFAQRLAQALGKTPEQVQAVLEQAGGPGGRNGGMTRPGGDSIFSGAAQQLGVTPEQLREAMRAAGQALMPQGGQGQSGPGQRGPGMGRLDSDAFLNAIAQQLGRNITGAQVRAALEANRPVRPLMPGREQIQQQMDAHLQQLATALGVTADQLKAALQSIGGDHGPRGNGGPGMGRGGR